MLPLLLLAYAALGVSGRVTSKACSNIVAAKSNRARYMLYLVLTGIIACFVFFVKGGFKIGLTANTLAYAAVYALICVLSTVCHVTAFQLANISEVVIFSTFGGLVATSAVGFFGFHEPPEPRALIKIAVMLVATVFSFIETKRAERDAGSAKKTRASLKLVLVLILLIVAGSGNVATLKLFGEADGVSDINSMFFFTNLFIAAGAAVIFALTAPKSKNDAADAFNMLRPLSLLLISTNTAISNLQSAISAELIFLMPVSVYNPVSSAIGVLVGVAASFIYRERHGIFFYLSALVALFAVII